MLGAPAKVDALRGTLHPVAPDDRTLGARTGVKRESGAIVQMTVLNEHVVRNAPDDAVAIEIAHRHSAHRDAIAFIQANGAIVERALVDHFIMGLVAIDREVLDDDISDAGALKQ